MIKTNIISHIHPKTEAYIGSPSITKHATGLFVSHDYFGKNANAHISGQTEIYSSFDDGITWQHRSTVPDMFWASLFVHRDSLYLLGTTKEHGSITIRKSNDGVLWSAPTIIADGMWHTAPVPIVHCNGRIWRGIEDAHTGTVWPSRYRARCISAFDSANLLDPTAWTISEALASDALHNEQIAGWLEGNIVIDHEEKLHLVLRVESATLPNTAASVQIASTHSFTPDTAKLISLPGGTKKFTIRYDSVTKKYLSLTNPVTDTSLPTNPSHIRNTLSLISSDTLEHWRAHTTLLTSEDIQYHGFQYVDWIIDEEDIVATVRTAAPYNGELPHNFHDANLLLFFRLKNFRTLLADE